MSWARHPRPGLAYWVAVEEHVTAVVSPTRDHPLPGPATEVVVAALRRQLGTS